VDSRHKIRTTVPAGENVQIVSGYFDPLLAAHAERLEAIKRPGARLVVALADPPDPILPARARAELVAALRCVDYVVHPGDGIAHIEHHFEQEDQRTASAFVARVRERMD
jgi:bifunctional ADP-heptose synthase (sugar kinase/adenylyltransferase)